MLGVVSSAARAQPVRTLGVLARRCQLSSHLQGFAFFTLDPGVVEALR
jgi:hypothetical protein